MQRLDSVGQTLFRLQDITRLSQVRLFVGFMPSASANEAPSTKPELHEIEPVLAAKNISTQPDAHHEGGLNE